MSTPVLLCESCNTALTVCEHLDRRIMELEARDKEFTRVLTIVKRTEQRLHGLAAAFLLDVDRRLGGGGAVDKSKVLELLREADRWLVDALGKDA